MAPMYKVNGQWYEMRDEKIIQYFKSGKSAYEIGLLMKITHRRVLDILRHYGAV